MNTPICMSEEYWANSQLSIARYFGRINMTKKLLIVFGGQGRMQGKEG